MSYVVTLGHVIRQERKLKGYRLRDLSARAKVALGYLSEIERGDKEASSTVVAAIAEALGMPVWALLQKVVDSLKS